MVNFENSNCHHCAQKQGIYKKYFWSLNCTHDANSTSCEPLHIKTVPFIEVYLPHTNESCILPQKISLEKIMQNFHRNYHTQTNLLSCGGGKLNITDRNQSERINNTDVDMPSTCILYLPGKGYIHAFNLREKRYGHSSWTLNNGTVLLLGGYFSPTTTEKLNLGIGNSSIHPFDLRHPIE